MRTPINCLDLLCSSARLKLTEAKRMFYANRQTYAHRSAYCRKQRKQKVHTTRPHSTSFCSIGHQRTGNTMAPPKCDVSSGSLGGLKGVEKVEIEILTRSLIRFFFITLIQKPITGVSCKVFGTPHFFSHTTDRQTNAMLVIGDDTPLAFWRFALSTISVCQAMTSSMCTWLLKHQVSSFAVGQLPGSTRIL